MAMEGKRVNETFQAGSDLSAARYHIVRQSAGNVCDLATSPNSAALGVLDNHPQSGEAACVNMAGMTKIVAGSSMAVGALFTASASGRAVTVSSGGYVYGRVAEASTADGDIITALLAAPWKFAG